jgi:hypothetical protein
MENIDRAEICITMGMEQSYGTQERVKMRPEQGPWVPFNNICMSMGTEQSA